MKKIKTHGDEWLPPEPGEEDIRHRAYELWLADGQVHGHDVEHWFAARQMLLHETKELHENGPESFMPPHLLGVGERLPRVEAHASLRTHRPGEATAGGEERPRTHRQPRRTPATLSTPS